MLVSPLRRFESIGKRSRPLLCCWVLIFCASLAGAATAQLVPGACVETIVEIPGEPGEYYERCPDNPTDPCTALSSITGDCASGFCVEDECLLTACFPNNFDTPPCSGGNVEICVSWNGHCTPICDTDPGEELACPPDPASFDLISTKVDALTLDVGDDGFVDGGDEVEYTIQITNPEAFPLPNVDFFDDETLGSNLVDGSVTTSAGSVAIGNAPGATEVLVDLGTMAPGAQETISFRVVVDDPESVEILVAQGCAGVDFAFGCNGYVTDDPSTGIALDATRTGVGDFGIYIHHSEKLSDTSGWLSVPGSPGSPGSNPGGLLDNGDRLGLATEALGDIDGDSVPDIAVAASYDDDGFSNAGAIYILLMNLDGTVKQRTKISATSGGLDTALTNAGQSLSPTSIFGADIAFLGDLDGAGPSDFALAVGANVDPGGGTQRGSLFVLFMDANPVQVLSLEKIADGVGGFPSGLLSDNDYFGAGLAVIGDLNADGTPELAVGASGDDDASTDAGAVYVLFLGADGRVKASPAPTKLTAPSLGQGILFGGALAPLGPFDTGDAIPDLAIGSYAHDAGNGYAEGSVWLASLNADGTLKGSLTEISSAATALLAGVTAADDRFSGGIAAFPDFDGNGTPELLVGSNKDDDGNTDAGALYLLFLDPTTPSDPVSRIEKLSATTTPALQGLETTDRLGWGVEAIGDLDGDGISEIAVGAFLDDDGGSNNGAVYLLYPVPEPGTTMMLLWGITGACALARRRR